MMENDRKRLLRNAGLLKERALRFLAAEGYRPLHVAMEEEWTVNDVETPYMGVVKRVFSLSRPSAEGAAGKIKAYVPGPKASRAALLVIGLAYSWPVWLELDASENGVTGGERRLPWLYDNYMTWTPDGERQGGRTNATLESVALGNSENKERHG